MEGMRELLRGSLGKSLLAMQEEDRLAAAWAVACGRSMAGRGEVAGYEGGVIRIVVTDEAWLRQMRSMQGQLAADMARISGVKVDGIHFELKR